MFMIEKWKNIIGYEGLYQISNKGRIKSVKRQGSKGGIKNYRIGDTGYYQVWLSKNQKAKEYKVHRLVGEVDVGEARTSGTNLCSISLYGYVVYLELLL